MHARCHVTTTHSRLRRSVTTVLLMLITLFDLIPWLQIRKVAIKSILCIMELPGDMLRQMAAERDRTSFLVVPTIRFAC
jgi:hypothetical protein